MTNLIPQALNVKQSSDGAWLVYEVGWRPIEGLAVHKYTWGWRCECGVILNGRSTVPACAHIRAVWQLIHTVVMSGSETYIHLRDCEICRSRLP